MAQNTKDLIRAIRTSDESILNALVEKNADIEAMWVLKNGEIVRSHGFGDYCYTPQN